MKEKNKCLYLLVFTLFCGVCFSVSMSALAQAPAGATQYNSTNTSMEYSNGTGWLTLGAPTCSVPFAGAVRYNATTAAMEYCNGTSWQATAVATVTATSTATATATATQPTFSPGVACGGAWCMGNKTTADGYCKSIGMNSAASYTQQGPGCNSCSASSWTGSGWTPPANHCNSCSYINSITCQ